MKKLLLFSISILAFSTSIFAQCTDLFFSEYVEGESNNKGIEIYNPTTETIQLSDYSVFEIVNGGSATNTFQLYDSLEPFSVMVITTDQADSAGMRSVADTALPYPSIVHFNGDDAVVLVHGTDTIDIIGERWTDPGSEWSVDTGATREYTLVRKFAVEAGQLDWSTGATEWDVHPRNTFSNLGSHMSECERKVNVANLISTTNIYPNPSNGTFNISNMLPIQNIQVTDAQGKVVYMQEVNNETKASVELNATPGVYFIQVMAEGTFSTNRVILN